MLNRNYKAVGSGCLLLLLAGVSCNVASAQTAKNTAAAPNGPTCTVEYRPRKKNKTVEVQAPLSDATTVQEILKKTKSSRKFSRMDVAVARKTPGTNKVEYFKVPYDNRKKSISMLHDYALHPGDRVIVVESTTSAINDWFDDITKHAMGSSKRK